ncbi:MAG: hypothetical protein CL678_16280 [Bdellovibrionaceae bacterium]|nr:hypothetical protein [Pseudobdellovibrionaceae bacterium]|tara:strand:+ start:484 stop:1686 length:1203 start_codon:yes stop_codon:yes gene_type:complete
MKFSPVVVFLFSVSSYALPCSSLFDRQLENRAMTLVSRMRALPLSRPANVNIFERMMKVVIQKKPILALGDVLVPEWGYKAHLLLRNLKESESEILKKIDKITDLNLKKKFKNRWFRLLENIKNMIRTQSLTYGDFHEVTREAALWWEMNEHAKNSSVESLYTEDWFNAIDYNRDNHFIFYLFPVIVEPRIVDESTTWLSFYRGNSDLTVDLGIARGLVLADGKQVGSRLFRIHDLLHARRHHTSFGLWELRLIRQLSPSGAGGDISSFPENAPQEFSNENLVKMLDALETHFDWVEALDAHIGKLSIEDQLKLKLIIAIRKHEYNRSLVGYQGDPDLGDRFFNAEDVLRFELSSYLPHYLKKQADEPLENQMLHWLTTESPQIKEVMKSVADQVKNKKR